MKDIRLVVALDRVGDDLEIERAILEPLDLRIESADESAEPRAKQLAKASGLMANRTRIGPALLDQAPECRGVVTYGVGYDHVDLDEAVRRQIVVCNVRDYCSEEVADHTMALTLALLRRLVPGDRAVRHGKWGVAGLGPIRRVRGLTMGLVGYGRIGQLVRQRAQAFGLRAVVYDPALSAAQRDELGSDCLGSFRELLGVSDIVSLHLPLLADTRGLMDALAFADMNPGSYLINTSRGALVDHAALFAALDAGHLAGAGLDVFTTEPPPVELFDRPDIVVTPHTAYYSLESIDQLKSDAATIMGAVLTGGELGSRVV